MSKRQIFLTCTWNRQPKHYYSEGRSKSILVEPRPFRGPLTTRYLCMHSAVLSQAENHSDIYTTVRINIGVYPDFVPVSLVKFAKSFDGTLHRLKNISRAQCIPKTTYSHTFLNITPPWFNLSSTSDPLDPHGDMRPKFKAWSLLRILAMSESLKLSEGKTDVDVLGIHWSCQLYLSCGSQHFGVLWKEMNNWSCRHYLPFRGELTDARVLVLM